MQEPIDTSLFINENSYNSLTLEFEKIISKIRDIETEFQSSDEVFKPFLIGSILNEIKKGLTNPNIQMINTPAIIYKHLSELISLRRNLKNHFTEMHTPLISKISDSEFSLVCQLIVKLESSEQPLHEAWDNHSLVEDMLNELITEYGTTQAAQETKDVLNRYYRFIFNKTLQQTINQKIKDFYLINPDSYNNYEELLSTLNPIIAELNNFIIKARSANLNDSVVQISEVLSQIDTIKAQYVKKQLDNQIEVIRQNLWSTVDVKKTLYLNLIETVELFLIASPLAQLSEVEKETYIEHLHRGFELCTEERFLVLILQCANSFYRQDLEKTQLLENYANSSRTKMNPKRPILKKRVHFDDSTDIQSKDSVTSTSEDSVLPKAKKRVLEEKVESEKMEVESSLVQSFINIVKPIIQPGENISRNFGAALLKALGASIWSIKELNGTFKVTINYDMLVRAHQLCPEENAKLKEALTKQIAYLKSKNTRILSDYTRFSTKNNLSQTPNVLTQEEFNNILSEFIGQLTTYLPQKSMDRVIEILLDDWKKWLITDGFIDSKFIEQMMGAVQGRTRIQEIHSSSSSDSDQTNAITPQKKFKSLTSALLQANSDEFSLYLANLSKKFEDNKFYLDFLTNKDRQGNTPLHKALGSGSFNNMAAYLNAIKKLYGNQGHLFRSFLVSQTKTGHTFLHQVAAIGNLDLLVNYTAFLKSELSPRAYAVALRIETKLHLRPFCNQEVPGHIEVNDYLKKERINYPEQPHVPRDKFFKERDRDSNKDPVHKTTGKTSTMDC